MSAQKDYEDRKAMMHLLNSGSSPRAAAQELGRSPAWGYKWKKRYTQAGWSGLAAQSRAPKRVANRTAPQIEQAVLRLRSELEAAAEEADCLGYIGAGAIRGRLCAAGEAQVPSLSTIERILRRAGRTKPRQRPTPPAVVYPHLRPTAPHQLTQVDIVPHYLRGGTCLACFNSIDVVSRYPAGQQFAQKRAQDALSFLLHTWREVGRSIYLQMDNESCFNGGYKHPGVIGQVVRAALYVGVQPLFSPFYHPESNAFVERFHQDYLQFVWDKVELDDLAAVRQRSALFFPTFRRSCHQTALHGQAPQTVHHRTLSQRLPLDFTLPKPLPITAGQVHFLRAIDEQRQVFILNKLWAAGTGTPGQGVWATLVLKPEQATLHIYDAAPDAPRRQCLARHPFPLREPVVPLKKTLALSVQPAQPSGWWDWFTARFKPPPLSTSTMS